jgi:hypothetical protein
MKVGDLVTHYGRLGRVVEEETDSENNPGYWVEWFEDRENWQWYSFDERFDARSANIYDQLEATLNESR